MRKKMKTLILSDFASRRLYLAEMFGRNLLLLVTALSTFAVFFIFYFIARDGLPFFRLEGFREFFTSRNWYPSAHPASFGALSLFVGTGMVTICAVIVAAPPGIAAAVCLSDLLPFNVRQIVKPTIEILAAIPSVAYGFFALVIFAPLLQTRGGLMLSVGVWVILGPIALLLSMVLGDFILAHIPVFCRRRLAWFLFPSIGIASLLPVYLLAERLVNIEISSGTNALNVSVILGIMALPTIVSVSEDALQAVGREIREGSYALGATRAETIFKTVIPGAFGGILASVILGIMRAVGETMVVWMASGNAAKIPEPWYNVLQPIRTITATIAGDMGEADHVSGSSRFHALFALALCLLIFSFIMNLVNEMIVRRSRRRFGK